MKLVRFCIALSASSLYVGDAFATWVVAYDCTSVTNTYADSGVGESCTLLNPKTNAKTAARSEFWGDADGRCDTLYAGSTSFWDTFCDGTLATQEGEGYYASAYDDYVISGLYPTDNVNHGDLYNPGQCTTPSINPPTYTYTLTDLGGGCWRATTQSLNYRCGCKVRSDYYYP